MFPDPPLDPGSLFLKTELMVGLSFAAIALQSRALGWQAKSERNRTAAHRAYEAIVRFRRHLHLSPSQYAEFQKGFALLGQQLNRLGVVVGAPEASRSAPAIKTSVA